MANPTIGQSVPRKEGREKVTGRARYVADMNLPGMLFGVTVRSPIARGRLAEFVSAMACRGMKSPSLPQKIFLARIPSCLLEDDQPCLAAELVNHAEEAVVVLAHPDKYLVEEARRAVQFDIEPLPPIFSIDDSLGRKEIIWRADNIFKSLRVEKGDVDAALAGADFIVEGEYETELRSSFTSNRKE